MGRVVAAFDEKLKRPVALKILHEASRKKRLLREARILSQLDHPNICKIFDLVETGSDSILVMERIEGSPLSELEVSALSLAARLEIGRQIAEAFGMGSTESVGDLLAMRCRSAKLNRPFQLHSSEISTRLQHLTSSSSRPAS